MDSESMRIGMLAEAADVNRQMAEVTIEKLQAVVSGIDGQVRGAVKEAVAVGLGDLRAEVRATTAVLQGARRSVTWRVAVLAALVGLAAGLAGGFGAWMIARSMVSYETVAADRDALAAQVAEMRRAAQAGRGGQKGKER